MRISTAGQQDLLITNALQNQIRAAEQQQKISSGKIASDFEGLADRAQTTLNTRSLLDRTQAFRDVVEATRLRLGSNDTSLTAMVDTAQNVRGTILNAIATGTADGLAATMEQSFAAISGLLNTEINDQFIFAGSRTDTPPSVFTDLASLVANGSTVGAFANDQVLASAQISEGVSVPTGIAADTIANDLFQSFLDIDALGLPVNGQLSQPQITALTAELQNFEAAIDVIEQAQTNNGITSQQLEVTDTQLADQEIFLQVFIGELEDADIAQAVSELQQDQLALEASFQAIGLLSGLSLINFI